MSNSADGYQLPAALRDAARLRPGLRAGYVTDVRWIFMKRLQALLLADGWPVRERPPHDIGGRLRKGDVALFDQAPARYPTGVPTNPMQSIDAMFCITYGFDDYSWDALNYAHEKRHKGRKEAVEPRWFTQPNPMLLGSFCVTLACRRTGAVPSLPNAVRCVARAEWSLGKTQSVWAWLGVWVDGAGLPQCLAAQIDALPALACGKDFDPHRGAGWTKWLGNKVSQHYGTPGDDEATLREGLGFSPGRPVSEEILFRSVCEIFGASSVIRHYRGRELERLELDVWVPQLRIGFEYQGEQHQRHVRHWHGAEGLARQQSRDARKKELCERLGYRVFYFYPDDWLDVTSVLQKLRAANALQPDYS